MSSKLGAVLGALVLVAAAASQARADDKSDIRESGKALAQAVSAGDMPTAKKHAYTDEKSAKLLDVMVGITASRNKLTDAAVAKFGEEGKTIVPTGMNRGAKLEQHYEDAEIDVTGDTATVTPKDGKPFKFKKDGVWKVDFTSMPNKDQLDSAMPMMTAMTTAMNETTGEIKAGKYNTVAEAKQALHLKIAAAFGIGGGGFPGGRPPRAPQGQN